MKNRWAVCPVPDLKSTTEGHSKMKIGGKEAHDTGDPWPHLEVERSNACRGWEVLAPHSLYVLQGCHCPMDDCCITSRLKALDDCSSHHMNGAAA